ncbi:hypothetical protein CS022_07185 [Veronia nyctiphanis]|uniref:Uncharacterized protein n=1 Tax=Veronia nyctiphanis TaxID=1278244 RepID=A0A4Q0YRM6_9GAMM|nr:hypothetical protein CS022_07185 [Veronia nyctiphanis]
MYLLTYLASQLVRLDLELENRRQIRALRPVRYQIQGLTEHMARDLGLEKDGSTYRTQASTTFTARRETLRLRRRLRLNLVT